MHTCVSGSGRGDSVCVHGLVVLCRLVPEAFSNLALTLPLSVINHAALVYVMKGSMSDQAFLASAARLHCMTPRPVTRHWAFLLPTDNFFEFNLFLSMPRAAAACVPDNDIATEAGTDCHGTVGCLGWSSDVMHMRY
jgi:hypothetical protein